MADLTEEQKNKISELVKDARNKIEAIKLYRKITGVVLKEAKDVIDHWGSPTQATSGAATTKSGCLGMICVPLALGSLLAWIA